MLFWKRIIRDLAVIAVIIIVAVSAFYVYDLYRKHGCGKTYVCGNVVVLFRDNISKSQIVDFLRRNNLEIKPETSGVLLEINSVVVLVPVGQEKKWVERLKQYPEIENTGLNGIGHIF